MKHRRSAGWWLVRVALATWFISAFATAFTGLRSLAARTGHHPSLEQIVLLALPASLTAALVPIAAMWLTTRRLVVKGSIVSGLLLHLGMAIALGLACVAARVLGAYPFSPAAATNGLVITFMTVVPAYCVIASCAHAVEYARRYDVKCAAELRLQGELGRATLDRTMAELRMLKMQINPHFLFNALNAVAVRIGTAPATAGGMVTRLAELLRSAMLSAPTQEVRLDEELTGLAAFIDFEQLRLGDKLAVRWNVADDARSGFVPHMLLQPLVENAIKHGIVPAGERGTIEVRAKRDGDSLVLAIRDDGAGLSRREGSQPVNGLGLANLEARLSQLYGAHHSVELASRDGDTVATVRLPWHEEPVGVRDAIRTTHVSPGALRRAAPLPSPPVSAIVLSAEIVLALAWMGLTWRWEYQPWHNMLLAHGSATPGRTLLFSSIQPAIRAVVLLAAFALARARPLSWRGWRRSWPAHAMLATGLGVALFAHSHLRETITGKSYSLLIGRGFTIVLRATIIYAAFAMVAHAVEYVRRFQWKHKTELRLEGEVYEAETQRAAAELRMLKMQLNPQFLFTSLSALSQLIPTAPTTAKRMIVELAALLRHAMNSVATQEVTLDEELAGVAPFLHVEQLRLGDTLTTEVEMPDDAREALVPHLFLRPLLERALERGVVRNGERGVIRIHAQRDGEWLTLAVSDSGSTHADTPASTHAVDDTGDTGLANLKARLTELYGARHSVELSAGVGGGTCAVVRVPWHEVPAQRSWPTSPAALDLRAGAA